MREEARGWVARLNAVLQRVCLCQLGVLTQAMAAGATGALPGAPVHVFFGHPQPFDLCTRSRAKAHILTLHVQVVSGR